MARVGVRTCDRCQKWDSQDQAVKRVTIVGPRRDLCLSCRVALLVESGVEPGKAISYVLEQDGLPALVDPDQLELTGVALPATVGEEAPNDPIPLVPAGGR